MFKQDRSAAVHMRVPFSTRPKMVTVPVTDSVNPPTATVTPIGNKFLGRPANRAGTSTSRTTSALASLTRFYSRPVNQVTTSSCSSQEKNNDDADFNNITALNLPSIGNSELSRRAPYVAPATTNMCSSNIVASKATSTSSIMYPVHVSNGRTSPMEESMRKKQPRGLVGLQNLGNTCFMNSCLQCVSNLPAIVKQFHLALYAREINELSPTKGALAHAFGDLIKALWTGEMFTATRPVELKRVIGKVASRFMGYEQQDAQEFLRFLLDGLHEDLNRVKKKPAYYEIKD